MRKDILVLLVGLLTCAGCDQVTAEPSSVVGGPEQSEDTFEPIQQADVEAFGRFGETLVASQTLGDGSKVYYTQPKPYGSWLCRVDRVRLPIWVVEDRAKSPSEYWEDDIAVTRSYAAWRSPGDQSEIDRGEACRDFRRFGDLFEVTGEEGAERHIFLLDQLLHDLSDDRADYSLACSDVREIEPALECDPRRLLRGISINSPFRSQTIGSRETEGGRVWMDELTFDLGHKDGHPEFLTIKFSSKQTYGEQSSSEAEIQSVQIELEVA